LPVRILLASRLSGRVPSESDVEVSSTTKEISPTKQSIYYCNLNVSTVQSAIYYRNLNVSTEQSAIYHRNLNVSLT